MRFDPRDYEAIVNIQDPVNGAQLQKLLRADNWMRSAIPGYNKVTEALQSLMEHVYQLAKGRTKKAVSKVPLKDIWSDREAQSFRKLFNALRHSITLAHVDFNKSICLFTDASDWYWSSVLTQIPPVDIDEPFEEQHHEPLSFLSGSFKGSQTRWSTAEKEAYAIVESVTRLDHMLLSPQGF